MPQPTVFISYSEADETEKDRLLAHLKVLPGVELWSDDQLQPGVYWETEIDRTMAQARVAILLITADFLGSDFILNKIVPRLLEYQRRGQLVIVPVIAKACAWHKVDWLAHLEVRPKNKPPIWSGSPPQVEESLAALAGEIAQLASPAGATAELVQPRQLFISYKRNAVPDESLARNLYQAFVQAGHRVFIDQDLKVGVAWAAEIQRQIEASDFMLVLLSEASVHSEMVAKEVEYAHRCYQQAGKARLLPVRVNYTTPLPYQLSHYLDQLQYAEWRSPADGERLVRQLLEALAEKESLLPPSPELFSSKPEEAWMVPQPYADPRFIETLREPSGAVRLRSEFYLEREGDDQLSQELSKPYGATITIRAPRQTGKSSLLIRGLAQARQNGAQAVLVDLQPVEDHYLQNLGLFLRYLAELLVTRLRLDPAEVEKSWRSSLGASDKLTYLMEGYILPTVGSRIMLALDEADRLLRTPFHDTFFGLLRFWHNSRAMNDLWENLDIALAISTEPHLLISDVTQSPFNVGLKLRLEDFTPAQVAELNHRYRSPLQEAELPDFMDDLNGHPYLTQKALYTMVTQSLTWSQLAQVAPTESSPMGDHLRRYLWLISQEPELSQALKQIIAHGRSPNEAAYYRLFRAGLIQGTDSKSCQCRCRLYERYLKARL
jgi:hypothetical protein